jgi:hypothetical protein
MTANRAALIGLACAGLLGIALFGPAAKPADALPTFAQAYHVDCSACHSAVPALNSYGRYIQRTGFAALDPTVMKQVLPLLFREAVTGRSTGKLNATQPNDKVTTANLQADVVGFLGTSVTYRAEQSFYSNNVSGGGFGRGWFGYHDLLNKNGHLFVGKLEPATMPVYSNWSDMTGFSSSSVAVGKHTYALGSARWGTAFNYVHAPVDAEISWSAGSSNLINAADFTTNPGSDKAVHYKLAYATPNKPYEIGVYGTVGGFVLPTAAIDRYSANGVYAQRDPVNHVPGVVLFYQTTFDSNAGTGKKGTIVPLRGYDYAVELYEPILKGNVMLGFRPVELTNNGAGTLRHFGNVDITLHDPRIPYMYATVESAFGQSSNALYGRPTWRYSVKWASPLRPPYKP